MLSMLDDVDFIQWESDKYTSGIMFAVKMVHWIEDFEVQLTSAFFIPERKIPFTVIIKYFVVAGIKET